MFQNSQIINDTREALLQVLGPQLNESYDEFLFEASIAHSGGRVPKHIASLVGRTHGEQFAKVDSEYSGYHKSASLKNNVSKALNQQNSVAVLHHGETGNFIGALHKAGDAYKFHDANGNSQHLGHSADKMRGHLDDLMQHHNAKTIKLTAFNSNSGKSIYGAPVEILKANRNMAHGHEYDKWRKADPDNGKSFTAIRARVLRNLSNTPMHPSKSAEIVKSHQQELSNHIAAGNQADAKRALENLNKAVHFHHANIEAHKNSSHSDEFKQKHSDLVDAAIQSNHHADTATHMQTIRHMRDSVEHRLHATPFDNTNKMQINKRLVDNIIKSSELANKFKEFKRTK